MAGRWSCEQNVLEFKDLQASALAVDCIGKWALLAGRKNLAFVDLDKENNIVMKVTRQSKWDIGCVQWNRHASHAHRFVTACNQRLDVFDFREGSAVHLCSLKAHSRTVSDIDWSPFDVNIVASCSVDTFTYLWDVRDAKKPIKIFQTVSGAYQVKWNKVTNNLFATTHDGDIRIWDPRKGNSPVHYISAHPSKIHGLDWSHTDQYKLVTASQDCTIRFWDYTNPRRSETMISHGNPVWRARFTPFGVGVMSVVLPQLRRMENSLYLWNKESESPIHTFVGHKDIILEFQWRKQAEGSTDHQLVTWSRDQTLRIWKIDPSLQKLCGHDVEEDTFLMEDGVTIPYASNNSHQEPAVNTDMSQEAQTMIPQRSHNGYDQTAASTPTGLSVSAPQSSSVMTNGTLEIGVPTTFRSSSGNKLGEQVEAIQAAQTPERKYTVEEVQVTSSQVMYPTESYQDSLVPFPRTCGARFCANDYLVMFNVPSTMKKVYENSKTTPRALAELVTLTTQPQWMRPSNNGLFSSHLFNGNSYSEEGVTISHWFTEKHFKQRHRHGHHRNHQSRSRDVVEGSSKRERDRETDTQIRRLQKVGTIRIHDISSINPVNKYLAEKYKIDIDNIKSCCEHNAKVASEIGRKDLVQLWTVISHMSHPNLKPSPNVDHGRPWAIHPFGRNLVEKFLHHYGHQNDVQTMAMLCCMFWDGESRHTSAAGTAAPLTSTYTPAVDSMPSFEYAVTNEMYLKSPAKSMEEANAVMKGKRSMSWSEAVDVKEKDPQQKEMEAEKILHQNNCKMLNPALKNQYEQIKRSYANILYNWQLLNQRTQVLKHTASHQTTYENEFPVSCSNCLRTANGFQCDQCTYLALNCSICHVGVRGTANVCLACNHGGHSSHMLEWFSAFNVCPTGCGCHCLEESKPKNFM